MAKKNKVTKAAIEKIVSLRNDKNHNYTLKDIAKILKADFNISITEQAVGYHYKRNKDLDVDAVIKPTISNINNESAVRSNPSDTGLNIQTIKKKLNNPSQKEYVELSDDEYQKLMKGE